MKKLVSIALSLILMTSLFATYTSAVRLYDEENGFVALQVLEDECEVIDNSETNDKAFNMPVRLLETHGIGTVSEGDAVKFTNVEIKEHASQVFLKVGYNLREGYETTNCEYSVYLDKIAGDPVGIIECFQYETANSNIPDQIYKYAACDVEPGTYTVYVVLTNEYSGSFSEVGFIYDDGEFDENWKDNPAAFVETVAGAAEEAEPRVPYTYTGENIFYISDNGDDMNDGLTPETAIKTMTKATLLLGERTDCTLVVVDTHTYERPIPACTLVGADSYSKLQTTTSWRVDLAGDVTIKNLIVSTSVDWGYILAFGHKLVIDENVTTVGAGGVRTLGIRGGGDRSRCDTSTEIVIKSGEWYNVALGTRAASTEGDLHLTLYDTAKINSLIIGNADPSEEKPVNGSSTVKLVGKTVNLVNTAIEHPIDVMGNVYLDLTEFEEKTKPAAWANVDCIVLTDPELIPEDALPASVAAKLEGTEGEGTGTEGEGTGTEGEGTGTEGEGTGTEGEGTVDEKTEEEKKAEEEAKKAEEEKKAAEEAAKKAEEEKKAAEEAAKKAEEEKKAAEEAAKKAEEEAAKKAEEEAAAKKAAEEAAKAEEEAKKALEEATTEEEKAAAEEALKKAEEEKAAAEEAAKKAEEEAKAAEEAKKAAEEEAAKKAAEEEAAKKAQEEAAKKAEEEANKTDDTAADEGGMSPIIWVVIAVVVVAVVAAVVVVSKKKKA